MLDFVTWSVNPNIIDSFITVRWYGVAFAIGFWIGYEVVSRVFKHEGAPESWLGTLLIYVAVGTIIGSRLGHVFFYGWDYYSQNLLEIFMIWKGGLASHGGTIGIIIAVLIFSRKVTHKSPMWTFDRLVIPVGLVGGLIRLGNLMNHEIYGHATDAPWGFRFVTNLYQWMELGAEPIYSLPSHPTQIYEAVCYFALFAFLMFIYWCKNAQERPGLIFGIFLTWLFIARLVIEFVKNDQEAFEANMLLNMGQLLSIPFIIYGIYLIVKALKSPRVKLSYPNAFPDEKGKRK
ncbi:MAG: prolipoprotein diacylglyceryl transferase [Bacteroidales bacterium]